MREKCWCSSVERENAIATTWQFVIRLWSALIAIHVQSNLFVGCAAAHALLDLLPYMPYRFSCRTYGGHASSTRHTLPCVGTCVSCTCVCCPCLICNRIYLMRCGSSGRVTLSNDHAPLCVEVASWAICACGWRTTIATLTLQCLLFSPLKGHCCIAMARVLFVSGEYQPLGKVLKQTLKTWEIF